MTHLAMAWYVFHPLGYCNAASAGLHGAQARAYVESCRGYNLWSGISGSFLTSLPGWLVAGSLFWVHHNCHQHRCPRRAWHPGPDGHPICKVHHPDHPKRSLRDVLRDHRVR